MALIDVARAPEPTATFTQLATKDRRFVGKAFLTMAVVTLLTAYLLPLGFLTVTSLKTDDQLVTGTILPQSPEFLEFEGEQFEIFDVPFEDGTVRTLALFEPGRESSVFLDPTDTAVTVDWVGRWRTLDRSLSLDPTTENFPEAWERLDFLKLLRNTSIIAGLGMAGTVISSTIVAYGLSRFRMPFKRLILGSLIATIIMPGFVTLVPTYALFLRIGWVGTWLPLIVPHFFANAYNVFLLRQFFLTIPSTLDEAAAIDGATPFRTLVSVILPQARGAIIAVSLFHFFFAWNDFLGPLIYLAGERELIPISVGLFDFLGLFQTEIPLLQAGALLSMAVPILLFLSLQRVFLGGIDLSGSIK